MSEHNRAGTHAIEQLAAERAARAKGRRQGK